jgi:5-methylcytosine-specific restriction endonuclease McrA
MPFDDFSELPRSCAEAKRLGIRRYFTGLACVKGHVAPHLTRDYSCLKCRNITKLRGRRRREASDPALKNRKKREYYLRNAETVKARVKRYRERNPEVSSAKSAAYRGRRMKAVGSFTAADILAIFRLQRGRCGACRRRLDKRRFHRDHIVPLVLGGSNDKRNIQLLCPGCNASKGGKHPVEFMQSRGLLL